MMLWSGSSLYAYVTSSNLTPQHPGSSMGSPCCSIGTSSKAISLSAAVKTATNFGTRRARLWAGLCILLTSCRNADIPP